MRGTRPVLPLSLPQGQLSHTPVNSVNNAMLFRQGAGPALWSATEYERQNQFALVLQLVRRRPKSVQPYLLPLVVTGVKDINTDHGRGSAMGQDMALGSRPSPNNTMALDGKQATSAYSSPSFSLWIYLCPRDMNHSVSLSFHSPPHIC